MEKQIYLDKAEKHRLMVELGVSKVTIWSALRFKYTGGRSDMIRKMALERGGRMVGNGSLFIPECDTFFETSNKEMIQVYSDRVKIITSTKTGRVAVLVDDQVKTTSDNMSISEFMNLQKQVQQLAFDLKNENTNKEDV